MMTLTLVFIQILSYRLPRRWIAILALSKPFGYGGVCFADPAAWLTTGILLIVTYYVWEMRMRKKVQ